VKKDADHTVVLLPAKINLVAYQAPTRCVLGESHRAHGGKKPCGMLLLNGNFEGGVWPRASAVRKGSHRQPYPGHAE